MSNNISFIRTYPIEGVHPKYLKYVELVDYIDTGDKKWYIIDSFDNKTPVFDNDPNIIALSDSSCMFLGERGGRTDLYVVQGYTYKNNKPLFKTLETEGQLKDITNLEDNHCLVETREGYYYFDKNRLERSSEIFDKIVCNVIDGEYLITFEKTIKNDDTSKTFIGTVTRDGKIGDYMYDQSLNNLRVVPKHKDEKKYDEFDYDSMYKELEKYSKEQKELKKENVKILTKMNYKK